MELEKPILARCLQFLKLENVRIRRDQPILFLIGPLKEQAQRREVTSPGSHNKELT